MGSMITEKLEVHNISFDWKLQASLTANQMLEVLSLKSKTWFMCVGVCVFESVCWWVCNKLHLFVLIYIYSNNRISFS